MKVLNIKGNNISLVPVDGYKLTVSGRGAYKLFKYENAQEAYVFMVCDKLIQFVRVVNHKLAEATEKDLANLGVAIT